MATPSILHPNLDADVPPTYDENAGMNRRSRLNEQEHEQSGNLSPSSDPVNDGDKPFRITYP
jgi:hypothetical protein